MCVCMRERELYIAASERGRERKNHIQIDREITTKKRWVQAKGGGPLVGQRDHARVSRARIQSKSDMRESTQEYGTYKTVKARIRHI